MGKTEIARRLQQAHQLAQFLKVEASKFTEVGYVGRDVESMIRGTVRRSPSTWCARSASKKWKTAPR